METTIQTYGIPDTIRAKYFAEIAHAGQEYNEDVPYTFHLQQVVGVLTKFQHTHPVLLCSGWLHDTLEDTARSFKDIQARFGVEVAETVFCVTNELGRNRKERAVKTYPKIKGNEWACRVKLADRIANVEYGLITKSKQLGMYKQEHAEFKKGIQHEGKHQDMWKFLDTLLGL